MNAATPFPWSEFPAGESTETAFRAFFEHAPIAVARCNPDGVIVEMNPAFERSLDRGVASRKSLRLRELVPPQDRDRTDLLLRDLLDCTRDGIGIDAKGAGYGQARARWTAWRQAGRGGEPDHALLIAEPASDAASPGDSILQTQRWEAIGRLAGGVVHDFNNLLTGVTLYCDLLLSSLDSHDRRHRYAEEIRSATLQAGGLVRQLLACARPQAAAPHLLSLNEIVGAMHHLLTRMIGENIILELRLDPGLGAVKIARAQAQQVLLNLVLNARDALPDGGLITVETSNCGFQPLTVASPPNTSPAFPCVLLVVGDNGHGMSAETRRRLFEPFFTTKTAAKGSGLGLTTVQSIVTSNHGLIHFESEPSRGTRAMILFPQSGQSAAPDPLDTPNQDSAAISATPFQEARKESLL
jgi:signal transduction histidine kinase